MSISTYSLNRTRRNQRGINLNPGWACPEITIPLFKKRTGVKSQITNSGLYERKGKAITNFDYTLPPIQSDMAQQTLKDPYIFDFLTLDTDFRERELEVELVKHLEKFLIELGVGFAFVGETKKNDGEYGDRQEGWRT